VPTIFAGLADAVGTSLALLCPPYDFYVATARTSVPIEPEQEVFSSVIASASEAIQTAAAETRWIASSRCSSQ